MSAPTASSQATETTNLEITDIHFFLVDPPLNITTRRTSSHLQRHFMRWAFRMAVEISLKKAMARVHQMHYVER
jgi:hypothetical protein